MYDNGNCQNQDNTLSSAVQWGGRTLVDILTTSLQDHHFDWYKHLKMPCFAYNTSAHSTTGYTPFLLMHGYEARLPVDIIFGLGSKENYTLCKYGTEIWDGLEVTVMYCMYMYVVCIYLHCCACIVGST